jgi:MFS family permease
MDAGGDDASHLSTRDRLRLDVGLGRNNGLLFWSQLTWGLGFALQFTLWPLFIESLGASPGQIGVVIGGAALVRTLLVIPAGALADRFSPKRLIVAAMAVPAAGMLLLALATSWWHALAGAIVLDLVGLGIPATSAYIAAASAETERTRAYTYIYTLSFAVGMTIGPAAGGWLAEAAGYRAVYTASAALVAAGAAILLFIDDIRPADDSGDEDVAQVTSYRGLLRVRAIWVVLGFHTLIPLLVFIGTPLLPNFLQDERDLGVGTIGTLGSIGAAAGFAFSLLVSHWRPLGRPFFGMATCLALIAVAYALFLASGALSVIAIAWMLRACINPIWSLLSAAVADVTPECARGRAYGLCEVGVGIGDAGAPLAAGSLYAAEHRLPLIVSLVGTVPLAVAAFVAHRLSPRLAASAQLAPAPTAVRATE